MKTGGLLTVLALFSLVLFASTYFLQGSGFAGLAAASAESRLVIDTGIEILYATFNGATTNFDSMTDAELGNISGMILERSSYGKIVFAQNINITADAVSKIVDLDSNVNISNNYVSTNATALTSLVKPASIYLYNLTFSNPRILKNGAVCSECSVISYTGGTLVFSVTAFSGYYSAQETPSVPAPVTPPGGGGGGGGGLGVGLEDNLVIDKDLIKVYIKQGETAREIIWFSNAGKGQINVTLEPKLIGRFLAISEDTFTLKPNESKKVNFDFFARQDDKPDAYVGRIIVSANGVTKIINVIVEIGEKKALFDIETNVIDKNVSAGDIVRASIHMVNNGDNTGPVDVHLYYALKDFGGEILSFREETVAIGPARELVVIKLLAVPANTLEGKYVFYSRITYGNATAASSDVFDVMEAAPLAKFMPSIIATAVLIIMFILLASSYYAGKRRGSKSEKAAMQQTLLQYQNYVWDYLRRRGIIQ